VGVTVLINLMKVQYIWEYSGSLRRSCWKTNITPQACNMAALTV